MEENTNTGSSRSMMPLVIGAVLLFAVLGGIAFFASQNNNQPAVQQDVQQEQTSAEPTTNPAAGGIELTELEEGTVKEFTVNGVNFEFDQKEILVNQGDTVRVTFTSESGMHDFVIDELNVKTQVLQAGGTETVEFVASEVGTFEFYCSVGQHRQMGMVGNLIVQ